MIEENSLNKIPEDKRVSWLSPLMVFAGLEFAMPVLMIGAILINNFSVWEVFLLLFLGLICIQWLGNSIAGYIGAKTGLSSSVLASLSFGTTQSKYIVGVIILIITLGWWAVQTSLAANALSILIGIDKNIDYSLHIVLCVIIGFLFALPSILGFNSIKWVDYIALPAGLCLVVVSVVISFDNIGIESLYSHDPDSTMSFSQGLSLVIGINVAQWLLAPDYTRFAKPTVKDNVIIPLGIIGVGLPLFLVGGIMAISNQGTVDLVGVMSEMGFPVWGYILLLLAFWTSQLVNSYTGGLVLCNIVGNASNKSRKRMTALLTILGIILAISGILDHFINFLYLTALTIPPVVGVIFTHYFFINKRQSVADKKWNFEASLSVLSGLLIGWFTSYIEPMGVPSIQSLLVSAALYWFFSRIKK